MEILDYSEIQTSIAKRLVETRRKHGLTLTGVTQRSGIAKGTLSNLESGKGNPTLETIWSIANILQVPFSELLQGDSQEQETKPLQTEIDKISEWLSQQLKHTYPWLNKSEPYSLITLPKIPNINTKNKIAPTHLLEAMKWCKFAEKATFPMSKQQTKQAKTLSQGKNITLACIAAEALTQRGIATTPNGVTTVKKEQKKDIIHSDPIFEHRINVNEYAAFELVHPAYARQVATLAVMASSHSKQGLKNIIDVGTGPGLPLTMLLELCPEVQSVTAIEPRPTAYNHLQLQFSKEKRVIGIQQDFLQFSHKNKALDAIISVGSSHHLDTSKFLQKSRELLPAGALLLVADEMISPFSCRKSRQSNLLKHHLRYIADTLLINSAEQKPSYNEKKLIDLIQDTIPVALFEVIIGNDDHAANMCRKLLSKIKMLDLSAQISHPFIAFYHFHILELEILVAGLDYEIEQKTFPLDFYSLLNFLALNYLNTNESMQLMATAN